MLQRLLVASVSFSLVCLLTACGGSTTTVQVPVPVPGPGGGGGDTATAAEIEAQWLTSGHADATAEAFTHWDEDGSIPASCARCHSTPGYQDWVGADGTAQFSMESPSHPIGTVISCDACHNSATENLDTVIFPSGATATGLGAEARCMQCHQGRESTVSLNTHIAAAAVADDDTEDADLSFRNIHYFAAGATLYGGSALGAYQYTLPGPNGVVEGLVPGTNTDDEPKYGLYDTRNPHVASHDTCIECHNPHTLERKIDECAVCHTGVSTDDDLKDIRMAGSVRDYDGDGNATEGVYYEIMTMADALYDAIQQYAAAMGNPIVYDGHAYPYYFNDDGNGVVDPGEAIFPNRYNHWTARLLRAAYNYQYAQKDPGAFAHNPKYTIEFLYDSLADLDAHASVTVPNFGNMWRNDSGHFDAGADAFRHWDRAADEIEPGSIDRGDVDTSCARCHSPAGFDFWAEWGLDVTQPQKVGDGFRCEQCHVEGADFGGIPEVKEIEFVTLPSGVTLDNDDVDPDPSFTCMSCHMGREAWATVEAAIATWIANGSVMTPPAPGNPDLRLFFRNVHYFPAAATLYGGDGEVGVEYGGKTYSGKWRHFLPSDDSASNCVFCHLADHTFLPQSTSFCQSCHPADFDQYRQSLGAPLPDYDGDGNTSESLRDEVASFAGALLTAIQDYATTIIGQGIQYDAHAYPYFFNFPGPTIYPNRYTTFDGPLLRACFNYQFWSKDPGAWAHNRDYMMQLLYDSIEDLDGLLGGGGAYLGTLTRPAP